MLLFNRVCWPCLYRAGSVVPFLITEGGLPLLPTTVSINAVPRRVLRGFCGDFFGTGAVVAQRATQCSPGLQVIWRTIRPTAYCSMSIFGKLTAG